MDYHEAANVLFDLRRYPPRPGIEQTADLLATLGDPHEDLTCVQIAGSNGKGTTARMVERSLREAGVSVGLYTSPHFDDVRERVTVDGRPIREGAVAEFVEAVEPYLLDRGGEGESPTFFESLTAMALWEFDRQDVDVAVLEVGIGGRYDATSVVDPVASAVTSVTLEHTEFLGDTVAEIARDKAHVAPADGPLVTATAGEALAAVESVADDVITVRERDSGRPDVTVEYHGRRNHSEAGVTVAGEGWSIETAIPTLGAHQARNAGVAAVLSRAVAEACSVSLSDGAIECGLRAAYWPGRCEVMGTDPLVVLDGAHNPGACETLAETLGEFEYDRLHLVFGALVDKDHRGMVSALPTADQVYTCRPALDRAETEDVLAAVFTDHGAENGPDDRVRTIGPVRRALDAALSKADPADCVLVTGSLHTVAQARRRWAEADVRKSVSSAADAQSVLRTASVPREEEYHHREAGVHRVVRMRLRPQVTGTVRATMLAEGGRAAVSGFGVEAELQSVVLMGTVEQFRAAADRLAARADESPLVARRIRDAVGIDGGDAVGPGSGPLADPVADRDPDEADPSARHGDATPSGFEWLDDVAVMGILNVTPDSFHDGGEYDAVEDAIERAESMVAAGVDLLDVGGESTRPGADPVPVETERDRVVPVIEGIREAGIDVPVSIDTRKAPVARAALEAGADVVNDVSGLEDPELRFVAAEYDAGLVVMHSIETPVDPEGGVEYDDVVEDVLDYLRERVLLAERAGIPRERILVDPGLGFGKSAAESFELLDRLDELSALGCPVLVGHSHKSMFELVGREHGRRLAPTVAATALAADRGADVIRVHDGPENVAAVKTALAVEDPTQFEEE